MSAIKVAVPVDMDQGLDSPASGHFGHCAAFIVSTIKDGEVVEVHTLPNAHHSSCAEPVVNLAQDGVGVLIAHGMGQRPFMVTQQLGISVVKVQGATAREVIENFLKGAEESFSQDSLCGNGSEHHHHH